MIGWLLLIVASGAAPTEATVYPTRATCQTAADALNDMGGGSIKATCSRLGR